MGNTSERITRIKVKKGEWTICWQKLSPTTNTWDTYVFCSKDMPLEELPKRLQTMGNHVEEICELPQGAAKKIVVSGVAISYSEENRHLVITALRSLRNSKAPMLINTPSRPLYPEDEQDDSFCMSEDCYRDLLALEKAAMEYVRGERAQQKLDFGGHDEEEEEEAPQRQISGGRSLSSEGMASYPRAAMAY